MCGIAAALGANADELVDAVERMSSDQALSTAQPVRDSSSTIGPVDPPPLRVLRVIASVHADTGGPSESFQSSCLALADAGVDITTAFPMDPAQREEADGVAANFRAHGVQVQVFAFSGLFPRRSRAWGVSWPLGIWLLRNAPSYDIVHVDAAWTFTTVMALLGARIGGRPVALTPHESLTEFDLTKKRWLPRLVKLALRSAYVRAIDLLIFSSQLEEHGSLNGGRRKSTAVLPHPVQLPEAAYTVPSAHPSDNLRVGFLGRFDAKKNLGLILEAAADLEFVDLRIAGVGLAEARFRDLSELLGLGERTTWLGFVTGAEKEAFFPSIDLLAMPSAFECFGMAAAEALAHGVPVLVSPTTGIAEIVERHGGGVVVSPKASAISDELQRLHRNPTRLQSLRDQSRRALDELSLARHGHRLREEYQRLLSAWGNQG